MSASFFFYDLETSGFNPRDARIMQFAGQRTDMDLNPVGEPLNVLVKMTEDTLPSPDAILITGITPQQTIAEGITEAEFLKLFSDQAATPGTIFVGFNNIRFDDEFIRFAHYRNFYDAYKWHYEDSRSRWDLLDTVRMTRALRPEGINWPVDSEGQPGNRLENLTKLNGLSHESAHDALSDVQATIGLARLLKDKQPKLFNYLLKMRQKQKVTELISHGQPFVYTSGKYSSQVQKTALVEAVASLPEGNGVLVYDLNFDPADYTELTVQELAEMWQHRCQDKPCPHKRLPVKALKYNRCPAVAPIGVLDDASKKRLNIEDNRWKANRAKLKTSSGFGHRLLEAADSLNQARQESLITDELDVDGRLYDAFIGEQDKSGMTQVRQSGAQELKNLKLQFVDDRLQSLLLLYKARNFPSSLTDEERQTWEKFRHRKLMSGKNDSIAARYFHRLSELAEQKGLSGEKRYLLEELQLWGQSILPVQD